jgi:hypothetical protein
MPSQAGTCKRSTAGLSRLTALRSELQRMTDECGHGRVAECRVIETRLARIQGADHSAHWNARFRREEPLSRFEGSSGSAICTPNSGQSIFGQKLPDKRTATANH